MTRNTALSLAALVVTTLMLLPATRDPEFGMGGLFILWVLVTVLLSILYGVISAIYARRVFVAAPSTRPIWNL
jgi:hypothetical protein